MRTIKAFKDILMVVFLCLHYLFKKWISKCSLFG